MALYSAVAQPRPETAAMSIS